MCLFVLRVVCLFVGLTLIALLGFVGGGGFLFDLLWILDFVLLVSGWLWFACLVGVVGGGWVSSMVLCFIGGGVSVWFWFYVCSFDVGVGLYVVLLVFACGMGC